MKQTNFTIMEHRLKYFQSLAYRWRKTGICPTRADFTTANGEVYEDVIREFNLFCERQYAESTAAILKIK